MPQEREIIERWQTGDPIVRIGVVSPEKTQAAPLSDEEKGGYPPYGPVSTKPAGYPSSDDPLLRFRKGDPSDPAVKKLATCASARKDGHIVKL